MPTLEAAQLVKTYGARRIVDDVSLSVQPQQVIGLLGPNGAGKTTTFHCITGLVAPGSGQITLDGEPITHWPFHQRARAGLHYLPQEASVFRKLSVTENLQVVLQGRRLSRSQRTERVEELLQKLGIVRLRRQRADTLSAGERRRVEIARALAAEPQYLLLDEPFTGIDPLSIEDLQGLIEELKADGLGVIVTDHNVRETLRVTDYVYLIQAGQVFWEGPPDEITEDPRARRFYLGERFQM